MSQQEIARVPAERVLGQPHPGLAAHILSYVAHDQPDTAPMSWQCTPLTVLTWMIDLEAPARGSPDDEALSIPESPVLGLRDRPLILRQTGAARGITVVMTPLGAHAVFGIPLRELTDAMIASTELASVAPLIERLAEVSGWPERFRLLDDFLVARLTRGPELSAPVRYAWDRLSAGPVRIDALADEVGWSRQHLNARFSAQIGLNPKTVGRITRLNRVMALLNRASSLSWPEIAYRGGYSDQAHLNRDFKALTGCTPTEVGKPAGLFVPPGHPIGGGRLQA